MGKSYMIGTLNDTPLLRVELNGTKYLVDVNEGEVFLDSKGLPRVEDKAVVTAVLEAAK